MKKIIGNVEDILSRNRKILEYRKTHMQKETAKKFVRSAERIRQIEHLKKCNIHDIQYYDKCPSCINSVELKKYAKFVENLDQKSLMEEVSKEAENRRRDFISTQKRVCLIKILKENYDFPLKEIANYLKRDRTTVRYLDNMYLKK